MPSNSRRYGRQWAPVFEVFEGSVEVRFMVVVVEAGGEILAWGLEIQVFFMWWGDGWG